jgi:alkanesulfonate monooxygenase SsuD/methylene tetrahydromethanopterin reductase-like flavin-dependent oxidoreductase (luciferase family)
MPVETSLRAYSVWEVLCMRPVTARVPLPLASATRVLKYAWQAEALGLDGVTVGDRWSHPAWLGEGREPHIDPIVTLGAVAAVTGKVELQTSVLRAAATTRP